MIERQRINLLIWIAFLLCLLGLLAPMIGCSDAEPVPTNCVELAFDTYLCTAMIQDHEYVMFSRVAGGGVVHSASCPNDVEATDG